MFKKITEGHSQVINGSVIKGSFSNVELSYWIEITTKQPSYTYYFGPFDSYLEAKTMEGGYIEDLKAEKATAIAAEIKRCVPQKLTIGVEAELF